MILDELLEFADATAVATATGTALLGDVIDLGATPQDFGNGKPMYLVIQVTTAFTTGSTSDVTFTLASDAAAAIATNGTASEHLITDAYDTGVLVAGFQQTFPMPLGDGIAYERYLGVLTTVGNAALTAGAVNAFLTFDPSHWKSYADATN